MSNQNENLVPTLQPSEFLYSPGNRFIDPYKVLVGAGLKSGYIVGDFGAGGGFYATAAAQIVGDKGTVYAIDVQEAPLKNITAEARMRSLRNITTLRCDLTKHDFCPVPAVSCDFIILANILHQAEDKKAVIATTYRSLKTGGQALVIEWEPTGGSFGPSISSRISEQEVAKLFTENGFKPGRKIPADPYHYAVTYIK